MNSLDDLFMHFLKDILYAERQLLKALPKMAKAANAQALKDGFTAHYAETEQQVQRLEQVFDLLDKPARAMTCMAIKGLIEEADEVVAKTEPGAVRDAGLIACAQAVEHYEMARYGALIGWATASGQTDVAGLLRQTLDEEKAANKLLNDLAVKRINKTASEVAKAA